ncbi:MAG: 1-deoxy-D-xylulose-5-phosphate synthase [Pseudomonadota bacterium]
MQFPYLENINSPKDLRNLDASELSQVCEELREYLIQTVSKCGGHFGASLGAVELTVALHYVYKTPHDRLVWDVGHQCYGHKVLTGRRDQLKTIRKRGGLAPFPAREESEYDTFGVGHSSTSVSAAVGMAIASQSQDSPRKIISILGDGGLSAGMAYEALNHMGTLDTDVLVILNDNEMSISPNVGAMSNYLTRIMSGRIVSSVREGSKQILKQVPSVHEFARRTEEHIKGMIAPGTLFEEMGINYYGPIDGHDIHTLVKTLDNLKKLSGPRLLHIITRKGKGYEPAETDPVGYHAVPEFDPKVGVIHPKTKSKKTYTQVFSDWICDMAEKDSALVAITPAMKEGSGLVKFSKKFPKKYFDVGIAEQHALTLAAGMACEGLKPVVAIYSTFLQRAYDQLIHDIAVQKLDILLAIDRAGLVGPDGQTHSGSFDLTYLRCIPHVIIMAPSNENECRQMLYTGFKHKGPAAVRYPRGSGPQSLVNKKMALIPIGKSECIRQGNGTALLVFGGLLENAIAVANKIDATVINMRFVKPLDEDMIIKTAMNHNLLVTIEDNSIKGGAGSAVNEFVQSQHLETEILNLGLPDFFIDHGSREDQIQEARLDPQSIYESIIEYLSEPKTCSNKEAKVSSE